MAARKEKKGSAADKQSERISRGLLGIAAVADRIARPVLGKRGFSEGQVLTRWPEIVGPELAAAAAPEKIRFERGQHAGGTLHLRVASGAAAVLLQPQSPLIIKRVNAYLGANAIERIKVSQGPLPTLARRKSQAPTEPLQQNDIADAEADIGSLESEPVRAALARLGARLKKRA